MLGDLILFFTYYFDYYSFHISVIIKDFIDWFWMKYHIHKYNPKYIDNACSICFKPKPIKKKISWNAFFIKIKGKLSIWMLQNIKCTHKYYFFGSKEIMKCEKCDKMAIAAEHLKSNI